MLEMKKLLTEMTDQELKEHLNKLRKIHAIGAVTRVRKQSAENSGNRAINNAVKNLDASKLIAVAKILARRKANGN